MSAWDAMAPILANQAVVGGRIIQEQSVVLGRIFDVENTLPAEFINLPRLKKNEEELRALLKQIQGLRNSPTVDSFLTSILSSMALQRKTNTSLTSEAEWRVRNAQGDMALKWQDFDTVINRYTAAIKLDRSNYSMYSNRSLALASTQQWKEALNDAEQARILESALDSPFIPLGYYRKHHALHGAGQYCEAICSFNNSRLEWDCRFQYNLPDTVKMTVREIAKKFMKNTPPRLFNTGSGVISDQPARLEVFEQSMYYMEMVSMIITRNKLEKEAESKVQDCFAYGMLSHRWESGEIRLRDIKQGESIYTQTSRFAGLSKLQNFCRITKSHHLRWAWCDTCCIDLTNSVELREAITSMFRWYLGPALTIIYLSDVSTSALDALTRSLWLARGWTLQELLAPSIILFYRRDWTLFAPEESLGDNQVRPNHKNSDRICRILDATTGVNVVNLRNFKPGTTCSRLRLQWAARRSTTKVEDTAYSLFGIFDIQLPILYGEQEEKALGRLIQEIVCRTGDVSVLN
ncbi:hypothetical protein BDR04DRAFT_1150983 [Suillus decipiens]|nr:hypothetical protein BDR04DRAFT_1150983 [Suillus decipiens]